MTYDILPVENARERYTAYLNGRQINDIDGAIKTAIKNGKTSVEFSNISDDNQDVIKNAGYMIVDKGVDVYEIKGWD